MKTFCKNTENCRRLTMLRAVGSSEQVHASGGCCDVCTAGGVQCGRLDILRASSRKNHRREATRRVIGTHLAKTLRDALFEERAKIVEEHPAYAMLGESFVCPSGVILKLCEQARYISKVEDIDIFCLRTELRDRFFNVVMATVANAPPPPQKRRRV